MEILMRPYRHPDDYGLIDSFLIDLYEPGDRLRNWLQPRWEYMHSFPADVDIDLSRIGIAEAEDTVVGVVHPEDVPAFCYLQVRPSYETVKGALVDWAEEHLGGWSRTLEQDVLGFYVDKTDTELQAILSDRGYDPSPRWGEPHARRHLDDVLPNLPLPDGFRLQSLADDNDLAMINQVLWRGFNHEGPPPPDLIPMRAQAQQTPNYNKSLNVVAVAPNGDYGTYAGVWYVPENRVAYVEPVATDPAYRRMGLGKAAVLETLRRARELGATVAWVGSDQPFYLTMGFEVVARSVLWHRPMEKGRQKVAQKPV